MINCTVIFLMAYYRVSNLKLYYIYYCIKIKWKNKNKNNNITFQKLNVKLN